MNALRSVCQQPPSAPAMGERTRAPAATCATVANELPIRFHTPAANAAAKP